MKFNWRANWELLLVLLIVSVVIVIATIAAIKNKDESEFGQLGFAGQPNGSLAGNRFEASANDLAHSLDSNYQLSTLRPQTAGALHQQQQHKRQPHLTQQQQLPANSRLLVPTLDDGDEFSRPPTATLLTGTQQHQSQPASELLELSRGSNEASSYDELSPEPNGSQMGQRQQLHNHHNQNQHHHNQHQSNWQQVNNQRRLTSSRNFTGSQEENGGSQVSSSPYDSLQAQLNAPSTSSLDLSLHDDIHTTRSSLAAPDDAGNPRFHQQQQLRSNQSVELIDDLLHPFGRSNSSLDESNKLQWLNSALLANLMATMPQQTNMFEPETRISQQQQQGTGATTTSSHSRGLTGSLPISMLFSDLIKLARPAAASNGMASDSTAPPTSKPQQGILQQLRSLPSPLSSLLQSLAPSNQQQQQQQQQQLQQQQQFLPSGIHEFATNTAGSNDASESSQHYHKISMLPSDLQGILARSMRSSAVLPAFPPPHNTLESWIPPNAGGRADYHSSSNLNADLVANNAAGFMRNNQKQPQQLASEQQQHPQQHQSQQMSSSLRNHIDPVSSMYKNPIEQQLSSEPQGGQLMSDLSDGKQLELSPPRSLYSDHNWGSLGNQPMSSSLQLSSALKPPSQQLKFTSGSSSSSYTSKQIPLGYQPPAPAPTPSQQMQGVFQAQQLPQPQPQQLHRQLDFRLSQASSLDGQQLQKAMSQQQPQKSSSLRRKRSVSSKGSDAKEDEPTEEDTDSPPLSVLSPDGQPVRFQVSATGDSDHRSVKTKQSWPHQIGHKLQQEQRGRLEASGSSRSSPAVMEAAGSGLMSKLLLGTASSRDEFEDDLDDDDLDSAKEKRKEEFEQTEFGLLAEQKHRKNGRRASASNGSSNKRRPSSDDEDELGGYKSGSGKSSKHGPEFKRSKVAGLSQSNQLGSSNSDSFAARRNQQRSDIEFYGHPGEETRQLKYGILGSGNYEVVNGGVYTDNDESAAAVNSIANYVRRPAALLPRLLGSEPVGAPAAFMPGGRLGGFLRGGSSNTAQQLSEDQLMNLVGGELSETSGVQGNEKGGSLGNPLMDFIYNGGNSLMDSSLLNHLGGSGSSKRIVHASQDHERSEGVNQMRGPSARNRKTKQPHKMATSESMRATYGPETEQEDSESENQSVRATSSESTPKSKGENQFHSYHLLPSKKVSIFSEKDLDSAPSEQQYEMFPIGSKKLIYSSQKLL